MDNAKLYPVISELQQFRKVYPPEHEIGIEIEVEGRNLQEFPMSRTWRKTLDGSLRGEESAEYVLHHPIPMKNVEKALNNLTAILKKNNAKKELSDRCGVHIHINVQHMTFMELINYLCLYLVLEPLLVSYCGSSREGNMFCLRAKDAPTLIDLIMNSYAHSDLYSLIGRGNHFRYAAVNVSSIRKHGSLEFRSLKTPKNFKKIIPWVNLLHKLKTTSYTFETPEEIINAYSMYEYERFLSRVLEEQAYLLMDIENINQKLLEGIRLVQDIAFTDIISPPITRKQFEQKKKELTGSVFSPNPFVFEEAELQEAPPVRVRVLPNRERALIPPGEGPRVQRPMWAIPEAVRDERADEREADRMATYFDQINQQIQHTDTHVDITDLPPDRRE